ncbi:MAG: RNA polymerase subunit sigma-70, partial [Myxococcales bacterium]|nr:RNA polymerase subunit sigma-70 [Myxococcales bacterium]
DMSNAEIAQVLEIPRSTVTSRLWRARELLREALRTMDLSEALRQSTVGDLEGWARSLRALVDPEER